MDALGGGVAANGGVGATCSLALEGICSSVECLATLIGKYVGEFFLIIAAVCGGCCTFCFCACLLHFDESEEGTSFGARIDIFQFIQDCAVSMFSFLTSGRAYLVT